MSDRLVYVRHDFTAEPFEHLRGERWGALAADLHRACGATIPGVLEHPLVEDARAIPSILEESILVVAPVWVDGAGRYAGDRRFDSLDDERGHRLDFWALLLAIQGRAGIRGGQLCAYAGAIRPIRAWTLRWAIELPFTREGSR